MKDFNKKNLWLIKTDKQSIISDCHDNKLHLDDVRYLRHFLNIYITCDEEIKEGDWWLYICPINGLDYGDNENQIVKNNLPNSWFEKLHDKSNYKKIILTTDKDLIKDSVQAIADYGFLEWFVKNKSCEDVEIKLVKFEVDMGLGESCIEYSSYYKIIIPKKEMK